ncbi:sigma-54-dependent Fis family transcriptional regulator [Limnohabitans sp. JirII-29]|uniref:sigma-54 interaction domain-containing protein n=1 Tax=Limnohabitans sp. JirII-29 TaxID=1835756 RepID=UPI000DD2A180|nr:sigma-54 dependent transcriptional regulator [Limnohabitans sp. JirII-29]PUE29373.1 sigma-54-dependent Fis family transcriptional regulator [Limnohabitans sp. JirII-29]
MNASSVNVIHAVWLDPFSPIDATDRAQLSTAGISLETVSTLGDLTLALRRAHVLVIRLGDSAELLQEVQTLVAQLGHTVPVLCRVDRRRMEVAVDAMRLGALHVLSADEWAPAAWQQAVKGLNAPELKTKSYVFVDPTSQHLLALAQRVAQTEVTALLVGPTGAGKEVLARVLHESSPRARGPFVALNCAALPEHLIEDMLFGHEKGAFTGALKEHKGLFEQAHGGTIFLDEIGEMPMQLQAKLLRVLQEKKLNRLGGEAVIDLDVRVIAATNKDLKLAIEQREFREDLYFRISTFRLRIQPLKERQGDIMPLVMQSLARHGKSGLPFTVTAEAQALLQSYPWPGNVRELENVVQRAVVLCTGRTVSPAHLMFDDAMTDRQVSMSDFEVTAPQVAVSREMAGDFSPIAVRPVDEPLRPINLEHAVKTSEHQVIMAAIQSTDSRMEAAAKLGISPRTLRYKLAQLRDRGMHEGVSA